MLSRRMFAWASLLLAAWSFHAASVAASAAEPSDDGLPGYVDWVAACRRLPTNRRSGGNPSLPAALPMPRFADFSRLLDAFFASSRTGALADGTRWVGDGRPGAAFLDPATRYFMSPGAPAMTFVRPFLNGPPPPAPRDGAPTFRPFVQRVRLPQDAEVFVHADYHGDVHSLVAALEWLNGNGRMRGFEIIKPGFAMVFLGDYADRGRNGVEVLATLMRLKLANPNRVFLCRGNHEEAAIAARYGLLAEGRIKYGDDFDVPKVLRMFDYLPVAVWVGASGHFVQCHHGGMEPGFDPRAVLDAAPDIAFQFVGTLAQASFLKAHPECLASDPAARDLLARSARDFVPVDPIHPATLGFMWNDFTLAPDEPGFGVDPGRAFVYGRDATRFLLARSRTASNAVHAVFRGHQQASVPNPMMRRLVASRGVFRHWQDADAAARLDAPAATVASWIEKAPDRAVPEGSVWTFNIAPDTAYGIANGFDFDAFGLLQLARSPSEWRLRVTNLGPDGSLVAPGPAGER